MLLDVDVHDLGVAGLEDVGEMGVGEDVDEGLLDGVPVLGVLRVGHGYECLYAFHCCVTHSLKLIHYALF